jgi:hypothetical protein
MTHHDIMTALTRHLGSRAEAAHWLHARAAIREHHGNQSRTDAEAGAWDDAKRLIWRSE